jgi:hypothetical protein
VDVDDQRRARVRVLVCGSRGFHKSALLTWRISTLPRDTIVMHGGSRGADRLASIVAASLGLEVEHYPADWKRHGKRAGILRNLEMLDAKPDLVIAFWDGQSPGTRHTINAAAERGIPTEIHR